MIVAYHPHLNGLNKIMWENLKHLNADQTVKLVFTPGHFVSFRKARRLGPANIILLSAKLAKMLKNAMSFPVI